MTSSNNLKRKKIHEKLMLMNLSPQEKILKITKCIYENVSKFFTRNGKCPKMLKSNLSNSMVEQH